MDYLIGYAGIVTIIALLLLINKHIIGGIGYNFFPPLIIGRAMSTLGITNERILIIIIASIFGWILTRLTTNYINLSLYPKYSLYLLISLGIFISMGTGYMYYNSLSGLSIDVSYKLMLFFLIIVSVSTKTYIGGKGFNSFARWIHISLFFGISFLINEILQRKGLYNYFLQHNFIIIAISILTIFVGSYTGLQLKEIIRFRKLIWNKIINKKKRV